MSHQAAEEYRASLEELDTNSKIQINALTMLAEDCSDYAVDIASCIVNQLKSVPKSRKLPILYLIDSICKNFPSSKYVELFTQNIVSNFCNVFEVSDEKVRRSLHKLRLTWNETETFPQSKLNAIDVRVHAIDPNWPILNKTIANNTRSNTTAAAAAAATNNNNNNNTSNNNGDAASNNQVNSNPVITNNSIHNNNNNINSSNNSNVNNANHQRRRKKIKMQAAPVVVQPTIHLDPTITSIAPQPIQPGPTIASSVPTPIYVNPTPIIISEPIPPTVLTATEQQPQQHQQHHHHHQQLLPQPPPLQPFKTSIETTILDTLYGGKQCSNCSLRFEENGNYANHLDWHFRQNKCDRYPRRQWYYPLELWIQFRDINDEQVQQESDEVTFTPVDDGEIPTATASKEDSLNICPVCQETFEKFWAEEEEEWRLRNARLHEERVYHPSCLIDLLAR